MSDTTEEILNKIESASSWSELGDILDGLEMVTFGDKLLELCRKYEKNPSKLYIDAMISKAMFYAILRNERKPGRDNVIRIGLAIRMTVDEINELLKLAGHKELYPKRKQDAIIIFALNNNKSNEDIEKLLREYGESLKLEE